MFKVQKGDWPRSVNSHSAALQNSCRFWLLWRNGWFWAPECGLAKMRGVSTVAYNAPGDDSVLFCNFLNQHKFLSYNSKSYILNTKAATLNINFYNHKSFSWNELINSDPHFLGQRNLTSSPCLLPGNAKDLWYKERRNFGNNYLRHLIYDHNNNGFRASVSLFAVVKVSNTERFLCSIFSNFSKFCNGCRTWGKRRGLGQSRKVAEAILLEVGAWPAGWPVQNLCTP